MKLAIFLPNWIGDLVMATPALRAVRRHYPNATITGVLRPYLADVLAGSTWVDDFVFYHPKSKLPQQRSWGVVAQLKQRRMDSALLMTNSLRAGAMAWLSGTTQRVGFARYGRGPLLTRKLYAPREGWSYLPTPAIQSYLQLAYALDCPIEPPRLELATTPADESAADLLWQKLKLPPGERVVVLNSGGAFGAAKHWPAEHFGRLARAIVERTSCAVLVNCGPAEREIAREICRVAQDDRVQSMADEPALPIGLTKACIRRARLLVSTDSGPRFFAPAFGVPVVALFGPTHIQWSRTDDPLETCLSEQVPCGPCMRRTCPLGHHRCMTDLSVERVLRAVEAALAPKVAVRAA